MPLLDCKLHEKLRDASDRNDHFAMMEMRIIIDAALAREGYECCPFETEAAVSISFEPEKFIALYDVLEADQAVESVEGLPQASRAPCLGRPRGFGMAFGQH